MGIGLSAADLKAMDFTQTQVALSNLYGGAASRNAETFQGEWAQGTHFLPNDQDDGYSRGLHGIAWLQASPAP